MIRTILSPLVTAFTTVCLLGSLHSVETQLQQGPDLTTARFGFQTSQIDKGIYRSEELVLNGSIHSRWKNIGLSLETWMALQDDSTQSVDSGELTGLNARIDYLFEKPDFFQLIPHLEVNYYPNLPSTVDEPTWLGVDFWYLLPWEGTEVGFSMDVDLNNGQGVYTSIASRQMYQYSPFDILLWQSLNFGDKDFHLAYSGDDSASFTTLELGAELTLPMPWEKTWIVFNAEYHYWLMNADRNQLSNDSAFLMGVSFLYRDAH